MRSLSRTEFPGLAPGLTYLDSAATAQKPVQVLRAMAEYHEECCANIHRGAYRLSVEATERYLRARERVAAFIGAPDPASCIFTGGTTASLNALASALAGPGERVLLTAMEHHSNLVPWQQRGVTLDWLEVTPQGTLDLSSLDEKLALKPKVVALTWVSNVFGTVNPVALIAEKAHAAGALVVVDGAQGVPHLPCDVKALGCDFLAFSGHKLLGPTGVGVLWGRRELLEKLPPYQFGGGMIRKVERHASTFAALPERLEAGTPPIAQALGLAAAVDYLQELGMDEVRRHEQRLLERALERLGGLAGMRLLGPCDPALQSGVVSFDYRGIHPHDLATLLDEQGICIRAGHHCCQPLMREIGMAGTARASFYVYNTEDDVDRLAAALQKAAEVFNVAV